MASGEDSFYNSLAQHIYATRSVDRVSLHVTVNCKKGCTARCAKTWQRQLVTLDNEATFVVAWHAPFQTTRQNRCLHGFRKCRGALIPHIVMSETEDLQGGVGLAMFHSSDRTTKQTAARMLSHNAAPAWSNLYPQRRPSEDAHRFECDDASLFAALAHVVSTFSQQCRVERVVRVISWPNVTL